LRGGGLGPIGGALLKNLRGRLALDALVIDAGTGLSAIMALRSASLTGPTRAFGGWISVR